MPNHFALQGITGALGFVVAFLLFTHPKELPILLWRVVQTCWFTSFATTHVYCKLKYI